MKKKPPLIDWGLIESPDLKFEDLSETHEPKFLRLSPEMEKRMIKNGSFDFIKE